MRIVAVGRKAFLFVGSERAGHAAAIYYSLTEPCKANNVNPLTYLTYVLADARNKSVTLPTPDEFADLSPSRRMRSLTISTIFGRNARRGLPYGF
jgi:hypothetical protein